MRDAQKEIIKRFDRLVEPLERKVKELEEFCEDGRKVVAPLALQGYKKQLNEWKELKIMIMEEFLNL